MALYWIDGGHHRVWGRKGMKKIAWAAAIAVAFAGAAKADWIDSVAVGGGYTQSPDLGYGGAELDMDYGYHGTVTLGWKQSDDVSFGLDAMFAESEYDGTSVSLQSLSVMFNAVYTHDTGDFWRPYIGAGAGAVNLRVDNAGPFTGSDWAFGYQGSAGVAFSVTENRAIYLGYRYQASEDVSIKGVSDIEYASHNFTIGVLFD